MITPQEYIHESDRLRALASYSILDTLPESDFDNLTSIAASICGTPISLISLIDDKRQWFKSHHGLGVTQTDKELAFCAHAINTPNQVFEISDARNDERFHDNPLVTGDPHVIFYAGIPLTTEKGMPLGTLCVIDDKPGKLSADQINALNALSKQVMNLFELRKNKMILEQTLHDLEETNINLEKFAVLAAHDLKSPLHNIASLTTFFEQQYGSKIDAEGLEIIGMIKTSSVKLKKLIQGLLAYSRNDSFLSERNEKVDLVDLIDEIKQLFQVDGNLSIVLLTELKDIYINRIILYHILINLISNAIKYNDKEKVKIEIGAEVVGRFYKFYVKDNGPGIAPEHHSRIFDLFQIMDAKDRFGETGTGIGLATVKKLIEKSGGQIKIDSNQSMGTTFYFTLER